MKTSKLPRVNREILDRENPNAEIRLIDESGEPIGIFKVRDALRMAESKNLDLIEISPNATPPVCKMGDFGKLKYDAQKKQADERKKNKIHDVKEVKFTVNIAQHDYEVKIKHIHNFLEEGHSIKVSCSVRGRDRAYGRDRLRPLFDRIIQDSSVNAIVNGKVEIKDSGGDFTLVPKVKKL